MMYKGLVCLLRQIMAKMPAAIATKAAKPNNNANRYAKIGITKKTIAVIPNDSVICPASRYVKYAR